MNTKYINFKGRAFMLSLLVPILALCFLTTPVDAKLSAKPDPDTGLTDPEDEQAVDALNDALNGPEEGQSWSSWSQEVKEAHIAVYGDSLQADSGSIFDGSEIINSADLCQSPLAIWMDTDSVVPVADAIADPTIYAELVENLQDFLGGQLYLDLSSKIVEPGYFSTQTKITKLTCTPESNLRFTIPITIGGTIKGIKVEEEGELTMKSVSASYREIESPYGPVYQLCFDLQSYDITGFMLNPVVTPFLKNFIDDRLGQGLYCRVSWWGN